MNKFKGKTIEETKISHNTLFLYVNKETDMESYIKLVENSGADGRLININVLSTV